MDAIISELKAEAKKRKAVTEGTLPAYPARLRQAGRDYVRQQNAAGVVQAEIARELGVPPTTVWRWAQASPPKRASTKKPRPSVFKTVSIVPERMACGSAAKLSVVTPHGYRVEGLDVASAAALLRELG